jgi:hypothetical protein
MACRRGPTDVGGALARSRNLSPRAARIGSMRRWVPILLVAAALAAPAAARADGGAVPPALGGRGVASLDGSLRFVTIDVRGDTVVESFRGDGFLQSWRRVRGRFYVPTVASDGSPTGLSVDGRTLVLVGPTVFPYRHTRLAVLDPRTLAVRRRVTLRGWFTLDALSPDGRRLYLTHYTRPRVDLDRYEVRVYDLARGRLSPHAIVDPREPDEKMLGVPVTRTMSADGRWAYTLYDRMSRTPFVHALDTLRGRAFCVDLDGVREAALVHMRLAAPPAGQLRLVRGRDTVALIDRHTFAVSRPAAPRPARRPADDGGDRSGGLVALGAFALLLAAGAAGAAARRRYARSASFRNAS